MELKIRQYRPSDKDAVLTLFSVGIREHIGPCFHNAMITPVYFTITLVLCVFGYLMDSVLVGVLLPVLWVGLIYYCCHEIYAGFVRNRLQTDMQDIPGTYLGTPDDCFWVAEAEMGGTARIVGMVALVAKQSGEGKYGELFRMIVSPLCRRAGLGARMAQTVIDFCEQRGLSKVVLETSTTQTAAVALYKKLGFSLVLLHTDTEAPLWMVKLSKVKVLRMEKRLKA
ncbi:N-acetyltransferase 8-like 2 [Aulostomus maculatus]